MKSAALFSLLGIALAAPTIDTRAVVIGGSGKGRNGGTGIGGGVANGGDGKVNGGNGGIHFRDVELGKRLNVVIPGPALAIGKGSQAKGGDVGTPGSRTIHVREAEDDEVEAQLQELTKRLNVKGAIGGAGIAIGTNANGNGGGVGNGGNGGQKGGSGGIHFRDVDNMVAAEDEEGEELHKRLDVKGVIGGAGVAIGSNAKGNGGGVGNGGNGGQNGGKGGIHFRDLDERATGRAIGDVINRNKDSTIVLPGVGVGVNGGKATPGSSALKPGIHQRRAIAIGGNPIVGGQAGRHGGTAAIISGPALAIGPGAVAKGGSIADGKAGKGQAFVKDD